MRVATPGADETSIDELRSRVAVLEAALAAEKARVEAEASRADIEARRAAIERARADAATAERDRLRDAYRRLAEELELLRRRIFVAKAERIDAAQLELEFAAKKTELAALAGQLGAAAAVDTAEEVDHDDAEGEAGDDAQPRRRSRPAGRRDVRHAPIDEERVELLDPELEGKAERIGFEESCRLGWRKPGLVRIVVARAKYRVVDDAGEAFIETTPMPPETFPRSMADTSLLAKILVSKFHFGMPFFRQEEELASCGFGIGRDTMCRWAEDAGMTLGATVVEAMRADAFTAFCIATDATGVCVQPEPSPRARQPCRRGHFFVLLADCDHVLFEYVPRETSSAVATMFKGYSGYVQADAKSVYDVLFCEPGPLDPDQVTRTEVGCWAHARRKFYEAAITKQRVAREALFRIRGLFELERTWSGVPPAKRQQLRVEHAKPLLDDFFAWAETEYAKVEQQRGLVRSAFGYVVRQRDALMRYVEDGRLRIDNNASERALRPIAVGRKAWLFVGSDDHAQAAGNVFSIVASCKLHGLDPEAYLRDVLRLLAQWPRDRYLELAPKYWAATRARLDADELRARVGRVTVPPRATEQPSPS